jgi:hypothetical protein
MRLYRIGAKFELAPRNSFHFLYFWMECKSSLFLKRGVMSDLRIRTAQTPVSCIYSERAFFVLRKNNWHFPQHVLSETSSKRQGSIFQNIHFFMRFSRFGANFELAPRNFWKNCKSDLLSLRVV